MQITLPRSAPVDDCGCLPRWLWYNPAPDPFAERRSMQFKMHDNSLFALLLRSPWWVSLLIAAAIGLLVRLSFSGDYLIYGMTATLPFLGVGVIALVRQLRVPSAGRVVATLEAAQALSWRVFAAAVEAAFVRDGFGVTRLDLPVADFELTKAGRVTLVGCKRWKAASHGIGPLQDLVALRKSRGAAEVIYLCGGELTDNARRYAADFGVRLVHGADLAQLLRDIGSRARA